MERQQNTTDLAQRVEFLEKKLQETLILLSDVYRYGHLQELLAAGEWKEADQETTRVMLQVIGKESKDVLAPEDVRQFPTEVLKIIDNLWLKYSDEKYGFSLQLQAYQELGGTIDTLRAQDIEMLRKLGDRVGWRVNGEWIKGLNRDLDENLAVGFFPGNWWNSPYGAKMANFFLTRLLTSSL